MPRLYAALLALVVLACAPDAARAADYRVAVTHVSIPVATQTATGLLFTPYREHPGDVTFSKLVVYNHGHSDTAATNAMYLQPVVASTGVPVLAMDNRGKPGAWNVTTGAQDTIAATAWFKAMHPEIKQTLLWGWSMGGITSGMALAAAPYGMFDEWLSSFGVVNDFGAYAVYNATDPDGGGREVTDDVGGCTPLQCPDAYARRTPTLHAAEMRVRRAYFVHGVGDYIVPIEQSRDMQAALTAASVPTSFYTVIFGANPAGAQTGFAGHGQGAAAYVAMQLAKRIVSGTEPSDQPVADHTVQSAPQTPPALLTPITAQDSPAPPLAAAPCRVRIVAASPTRIRGTTAGCAGGQVAITIRRAAARGHCQFVKASGMLTAPRGCDRPVRLAVSNAPAWTLHFRSRVRPGRFIVRPYIDGRSTSRAHPLVVKRRA